MTSLQHRSAYMFTINIEHVKICCVLNVIILHLLIINYIGISDINTISSEVSTYVLLHHVRNQSHKKGHYYTQPFRMLV